MQIGIELVLISSITTLVLAAFVGIYLLRIWLKQTNRLITDLPLAFAIMITFQALQTFVLALPNLGIVEESMILLRIRSVIIGGSIIPIVGALFQIWAPRIQKYHNKMLIAVTAYWLSVTILAPTEAILMSLVIPLLLIFGIMMIVTFAITWKTGRLKEVRSDLMILALILGLLSQILRVPLMTTSLFYLPNVILTLSVLTIGVAFTYPNRKSEPQKEPLEAELKAIY